jgi:hypothetical protein
MFWGFYYKMKGYKMITQLVISEKIKNLETELKEINESIVYYDDLLEDGADNDNYSSHYFLQKAETTKRIIAAELRLLKELKGE